MGKSEVGFLNLPEVEQQPEREVCRHQVWKLIAARNEWGEPQLWCQCGHVRECPRATLKNARGRIETGGALKMWHHVAALELARRIQAERR